MKSIGIVGYGIVGKATEIMLRKFYRIDFPLEIFDINKHGTKIDDVIDCDFIFVCVPTPSKANGTCDTSIVESTIAGLTTLIKQKYNDGSIVPRIIIRSTVPPGTTTCLANRYGYDLIFMPEFLTEATFRQDAQDPPFFIVGPTNHDDTVFDIIGLFQHPRPQLHIVTSETAEFLKYTMNCFFATKVVFANSMYDVAKKVGASWDVITHIIGKHPWIGSNHLDPLHGGYRGYSGKCLPKDTKAIAYGFGNEFLAFVDAMNTNLLHNNICQTNKAA